MDIPIPDPVKEKEKEERKKQQEASWETWEVGQPQRTSALVFLFLSTEGREG